MDWSTPHSLFSRTVRQSWSRRAVFSHFIRFKYSRRSARLTDWTTVGMHARRQAAGWAGRSRPASAACPASDTGWLSITAADAGRLSCHAHTCRGLWMDTGQARQSFTGCMCYSASAHRLLYHSLFLRGRWLTGELQTHTHGHWLRHSPGTDHSTGLPTDCVYRR